MTIEFVEETRFNDTPVYFTDIDGRFQNHSLSSDKEKAYKLYLELVKTEGFKKTVTILETIEL